MDIGIDASLDEEDDEDVWALEAGRVKTRRWANFTGLFGGQAVCVHLEHPWVYTFA